MRVDVAEVKGSRQRDGSRNIQATADALVVLRANRELAEPFGVIDPYAPHFVTDAGKQMAEMAQSVDPCFVAFNLTRYRYFTERLREAATQFRQLVLLGAGYDTRPISMPEFARGAVKVFEVDYPDKLASKRDILTQAGVSVPSYIRDVPRDLAAPGLQGHLRQMGFRPSQPTLVLLEGVLAYLAPEAACQLLEPRTLALGPGSAVLFDYWSNERIERLNQRVETRLGHRLFHWFPFPDVPSALEHALVGLGYRDVHITDLDGVVANLRQDSGGAPVYREGKSWFIVEATCAPRMAATAHPGRDAFHRLRAPTARHSSARANGPGPGAPRPRGL
jgi:methyltransferase (TIGR00027 family)